jgi:hypothetical protein
MPAFTFEKITPQTKRGAAPIAKNPSRKRTGKGRGLIVQMLDRFVEARIKKDLRDESGVTARKKSRTSD